MPYLLSQADARLVVDILSEKARDAPANDKKGARERRSLKRRLRMFLDGL